MFFVLAACGQRAEFYSAPHRANDTGFLIKTSGEVSSAMEQEQLAAVLSHPSVKFRTLSAKHGSYEVLGLSEKELHELAPKLTIEKNHYFESIVPVDHPAIAAQNLFAQFAQGEAQPSTVPPILQSCDAQASKVPMPNINIKFSLNPRSKTTELGTEVRFDSAGSHAHPDHPSLLDYRWLVLAPNFSEIKDDVRLGTSLTFTPDNVGLYQVVLVVEDNRRACGAVSEFFLVSHNPELRLPAAGDSKPSVDLKNFHHLAHVDAEAAWAKSTGQGVTIAVLDTGLNFNHRGIVWNLAVKQSELNGTPGRDDDGNEFIDDRLGWDFVNGDNNPFDDEGHGSHVSGITASHIFGISKDAKILPIKVLNAFGGGDVGSIAAGIYYAVDNGAKIINASLGSMGHDFQTLEAAINYAQSKNVLFVAAAGNGDRTGRGLDLSRPGVDIYPAELGISNILTVAATDEYGALTTYSNYGFDEVDVAAPGGNGSEPIWSLATQNAKNYNFVPSAGTSMASPLVAGVAGLVLANSPQLTPESIIDLLVQAGKESEPLLGKVRSEKVINANLAVDLLNPQVL